MTTRTIARKAVRHYPEYSAPIAVGDEVILIERYSEATGASSWDIRAEPEGIPGNQDGSIRRYHGWRGTTDGISISAHGLRRVLAVTTVETADGRDYQRVTVGADLLPDAP